MEDGSLISMLMCIPHLLVHLQNDPLARVPNHLCCLLQAWPLLAQCTHFPMTGAGCRGDGSRKPWMFLPHLHVLAHNSPRYGLRDGAWLEGLPRCLPVPDSQKQLALPEQDPWAGAEAACHGTRSDQLEFLSPLALIHLLWGSIVNETAQEHCPHYLYAAL